MTDKNPKYNKGDRLSGIVGGKYCSGIVIDIEKSMGIYYYSISPDIHKDIFSGCFSAEHTLKKVTEEDINKSSELIKNIKMIKEDIDTTCGHLFDEIDNISKKVSMILLPNIREW